MSCLAARDGAFYQARSSFVLWALFAAAFSPVHATELLVGGTLMSVETDDSVDSFRLRKLGEANKGFRTGTFQWNEASNSFVLVGTLEPDDKYYADIQLW